MLTYLSLHINKLKRSPFLVIAIICIPLLILKLWIPVLTNNADKSTIPIGWVDEDHSSFSKIVKKRLANQSKIRLEVFNSSEAKDAVQKGSVEAAFILKEGFEREIKQGHLDSEIAWIRTKNSTLDTFVKEKLAAEVMRLAVNSKAANTVQGFGVNANWQDIFEHSDAYWEPKPLFQMSYQTWEGAIDSPKHLSSHLGNKGLYGFVLFYLWLLFSLKLLDIYKDKKRGLITRIQLVSGNKLTYYLWNYSISWLFLLFLLAIITMEISIFLDVGKQEILLRMVWSAILFLFVSILTVLIHQLFANAKVFLAIITTYILSSYVLGSFYTVLGVSWLKYFVWVFPHIWLYQGMPG